MAWNEPGGGNKDPWGQGGDQGPPDLDELIRKMQSKLGGLFGGRGGGGGRSATSGGPGSMGLGVILVVAAVLWGLSGFYIVDEGKRGVVMRFGQFTEMTTPGLNWRIPYPIETKEIVDVEQRRFEELGYRSSGQRTAVRNDEALMLTRDENIVSVQMAIQYQVQDARDYLFNVRDPRATLKHAAESAVREVMGNSKMDFVLTEGRSEVVAQVKELTQRVLDQYQTGLLVSEVNMQDVQPPEEVQGAFSDAIKAREDEQRLKNEAEAYSNDVIPKARGLAARQLEEANGYRASKIAQAEGEASRFSQLLAEYKRAPEVTRKRLYLETMEEVLNRSSKVMVDVKGGNNMLYLPLDRMMQGAGAATARRFTDGFGSAVEEGSGGSSTTSRSPQRIRETR